MNISISGLPGSGTTTAAKLLAKKINFQHIYAGAIFRDLADKAGLSLQAFSKKAEHNHDIDQKLDRQMLLLAKNKNNQVIEGRLTGWIAHLNNLSIPKIWLSAPLPIRLSRISRRDFQGNQKKAKIETIAREQSEQSRYKTIYNIDITDLSIYDTIVDSSIMSPTEIVDFIIDKLRLNQSKGAYNNQNT